MSLISESVIAAAKNTDIAELIGKYIKLEKIGDEYKGICPFHKEKTPSFSVITKRNAYYCFGCGAGGDPIDFVSAYENVSFREAVERIAGNIESAGSSAPVQRKSLKQEEAAEWVPVVPVPKDNTLRPMDIFNRRSGDSFEKLTCSKRWAYHDANGDLIGYICRFELPGGGKDVIPQSFCVNQKTGEMRWRWISFSKPRPLYGLDKLAKHPLAQVIIVEGEKACDAAQALYEAAGIPRDKLVVVSWAGGGKAVRFTDWSPLEGRNVGLWPDADQKPYPEQHPQAGVLMPLLEQPGMACMVDIAKRLEGVAKAIKMICPPAGVADGWDLADELPEGFNLLAHTKSQAMLMADFLAKHQTSAQGEVEQDETMPWDGMPDYEPEPDDTPDQLPATMPEAGSHDDDELVKQSGFTILGYDGGDYFLFSHNKQQVMSITKRDLSDVGLIELQEPFFWESNFPDGRGGINKKMVANWIFSIAHARGIYDPTRIRGRGAWIDKNRLVYHHGSHLTVDGQHMRITDIKSGYVYPLGRSMPEPATAMTDEEGTWLLSVAGKVRWSMMASAALMAGWVMLAPICGALPWRPHIWLLGAAGSGKSTVQAKFISALLRGVGVYAQGDSTEAGIRQKLRADALPVLIDEIESNNDADKKRTENIIGLVRKTSSESWAETLKGTATGESMSFQIRSMFCLASINANMPTKADIDRLTMLNIKTPDKKNPAASEAHWASLEADLNKIDSDETIASRLLARALALMPVIRENIAVFRRVGALKFGSQREGDQFGTLMAGCWSLTHSEPVTEAQAVAMFNSYDFREHTEDHDQDDAMKALEAILSAKIRVGTLGDFTVYELIRETSPTHRHNIIENNVADDALIRHGIRVEYGEGVGGELWFGIQSTNLANLVSGESFVTDLRGQLLRVKGAHRVSPKKYNGVLMRGVAVPLKPILDDADDHGQDDLPI